MANIKPKYLKRVIEVADYFFGNPLANRVDVLSKFGETWRTSSRTFDRIIKDAKKYNEERLKKQEEVKNEILTESAKENIKKNILSRDVLLQELTKDFVRLGEIIYGKAYKEIDNNGNVIGYHQSGFGDEIAAKRARQSIAGQVSDIEGYKLPAKLNLQSTQQVIIKKTYDND